MLDITEYQGQYGGVHVLRRVLSRFERYSRGSPNRTQPNVATIVASEPHLKVYVQNFYGFLSPTTFGHAYVWVLYDDIAT